MTCLGSCLDFVIVKFVLVRSSLKSQLTSNLWASLALVYSKGKDIIFSHLTMNYAMSKQRPKTILEAFLDECCEKLGTNHNVNSFSIRSFLE